MKIINLLGNEYQGTIGKSVTASKWKGRNYLKKYFKPTNPNSLRQQAVRALMGTGVGLWHGFSNAQKGAYYWYQRYRKTNISPFNAMTGSYIQIENASSGTYVAPPAQRIHVEDQIPNDLEGAKVIIRKAGQATDYFTEYTDSDGETPSTVTDEDELYDIFITLATFQPYSALARTAVQICDTHAMTPV